MTEATLLTPRKTAMARLPKASMWQIRADTVGKCHVSVYAVTREVAVPSPLAQASKQVVQQHIHDLGTPADRNLWMLLRDDGPRQEIFLHWWDEDCVLQTERYVAPAAAPGIMVGIADPWPLDYFHLRLLAYITQCKQWGILPSMRYLMPFEDFDRQDPIRLRGIME